jgi:TRAP-type C4-dicarboxylate transport system substrate-binding protein
MSVVLAAATTGCVGGHLDKAGGSRPARPQTLTLATHDDEEAYGTFAEAVARLSGGSLRIRVAGNWRVFGDRREIDFERGIVADVRSGKVALGIVGARVWDTLGIEGFQALVAPLLIDSIALEGRAIESPYAARALAEIDRSGVIGIALLPGRLRRPLGITRRLLGPDDYRGATLGVRPGRVAEMTFAALGATPRANVPGSLAGLDGEDQDPLTVTENGYDESSRALTGNVVLWPKAQTVIMNRSAYDRLTDEQRQVLRAAGREAIAPELARTVRDELEGVSSICSYGAMPLVDARPSDLAALRRAVQPVYDQLDESQLTRAWIASIERERTAAHAAPDVIRCP